MAEEKQIIEGNKLIAKFMDNNLFIQADYDYYINIFYHCRWDWLMPVVEKIEALDFRVEIYDCYCDVFAPNSVHKDAYTELRATCYPIAKNKIEATWQAIVIFIKWHNLKQSVL